MLVCFCRMPVTVDEGRIWIVTAEDAVADTAYPYISVVLFPCLYLASAPVMTAPSGSVLR